LLGFYANLREEEEAAAEEKKNCTDPRRMDDGHRQCQESVPISISSAKDDGPIIPILTVSWNCTNFWIGY
jgi:hypothetical protein